MAKKFVGLDGLKHFWTKAKTWITAQITSEVTARIAELVANAPEDLDTLKEIADWISAHADDAAAMNTQITANQNEISSLKTTVAGKANSSHTHTKSQITDFPTSLPANGGTADKAVEVIDYGNTSRTVKVGYAGASINEGELIYLAGYTGQTNSSIKLKDVTPSAARKWLGIPIIKYADYKTSLQAFTQFQQVPIELSKFSSEVTPNNVLCFMVIYWSGVKLIATADWGDPASSGLKCALIALQEGTGIATVRCVYMV